MRIASTTGSITFNSTSLTTLAATASSIATDLSKINGLGGTTCVYNDINGTGGYQFTITFGAAALDGGVENISYDCGFPGQPRRRGHRDLQRRTGTLDAANV